MCGDTYKTRSGHPAHAVTGETRKTQVQRNTRNGVMNADEARQYAKELQEENKEARALGPLNKWLIRWCIRKIDKEIRRATKMGRDYYMVVFTVISPFTLKDLDKLFFWQTTIKARVTT